MARDDRRGDVGRHGEPSVFRTSWPAFAFFLSLVAAAAGFVALHHSLDDYRSPAGISAGR